MQKERGYKKGSHCQLRQIVLIARNVNFFRLGSTFYFKIFLMLNVLTHYFKIV